MACYRHDQHSGRPYQPLKTLQIHLPVPRPPLVPSVPNLRICQSSHPSGKIFPPCLVVASAKGSADSRKVQLLGYLIEMELYFYILSCEYMKTYSHKRTTQFRLCDMQFHDAWDILPLNPLHRSFSGYSGYLFPWYSEKISAGRIHLHVRNLPSLWLPCAGEGRAIYSYIFSWGQHVYPCMHLLSFIWQSWTVGHQPRYCVCPLHMDGEHRFPLAGVPPSKYWPPFAPFWWAHDTAPRQYLW